MNFEQEDDLASSFERGLKADPGLAAKQHLEAGRFIYYCEPSTPDQMVIKEYPSGRKELVSFSRGVEEFVGVISE